MTRAVAVALTMLLYVASAHAQDVLPVSEAIEREIVPGASHSFTIHLNIGDYVAGSVDQHGIAVLAAVYLPDGSRLRNFPGPREGKRQFAFIAASAGTYRLELRAQTVAEAAEAAVQQPAKGEYELKVTEKLTLDERLKPPPPHDKYPSPAIETLRTQIAHGENNTEAFWRQAAQSGTPIVEPVNEDAQHTLVTFLWRGTEDTHNVAVIGSFWNQAGPATTDYVMTRLADTDVWYLTIRMPIGARFAYRLSPNDPLSIDGPPAAQRLATMQGDPLNPHRWICEPTAPRFECWSMAELPGAPPQPWIVRHTETPAGTIFKHTIKARF